MLDKTTVIILLGSSQMLLPKATYTKTLYQKTKWSAKILKHVSVICQSRVLDHCAAHRHRCRCDTVIDVVVGLYSCGPSFARSPVPLSNYACRTALPPDSRPLRSHQTAAGRAIRENGLRRAGGADIPVGLSESGSSGRAHLSPFDVSGLSALKRGLDWARSNAVWPARMTLMGATLDRVQRDAITGDTQMSWCVTHTGISRALHCLVQLWAGIRQILWNMLE